MTEKAKNYWALMAALIIIALTSFTVQSILSSEVSEAELSGPEITGSIVQVAESENGGLDGTLTKVNKWIESG